jgi:hypothetical protein
MEEVRVLEAVLVEDVVDDPPFDEEVPHEERLLAREIGVLAEHARDDRERAHVDAPGLEEHDRPEHRQRVAHHDGDGILDTPVDAGSTIPVSPARGRDRAG